MASFSVPCPKTSVSSSSSFKDLQPNPNHHHQQHHLHSSISFRSNLAFLAGSSQLRGFQASSNNQHNVFRVHSQLNDVAVGKSPNSAITEKKSEESTKKSGSKNTIPDVASISAFMNQVADLVELVDSRDITELQLKQLDCELLIRKKEALPQPPVAAPSVVMQHLPPPPPAAVPTPVPAAAGPVPSPSAPAPTAPAKPKSTHPPLKCPMAGTFYCCPAPGAPPFVKVGDKVQKGQVICIIEAMKLMNEIEADQSGTIVEILVDDTTPVSIDTPLFVIEP